MNDTAIIFCDFFLYVQGSAVGRQSGCAIQCTNLEGCMKPAFFRGWFYISWMSTPEQNGSSYFLCNILTSHSTPNPTELPFPYASYELFITCYCLYRLPSCLETN